MNHSLLARRLTPTLAVIVSALILSGCDAISSLTSAETTDNLAQQETATQTTTRQARVYRVPHFAGSNRQDLVARVYAAQTIDLAFEVSGTLIELPVREGQSIERGRPIAKLAQTDFELAVQEAQVQLRLRRNDLQRKTSLLAKRGISQSVVDDAQAEADLASVRLAQARESLRETQLLAPFDAYVAERLVDNHSNVQVAVPIVRLFDLSKLHLRANVPEALLATITTNKVTSLTAKFAFIPDQTFALSYLEHRGEADEVAQTYEVSFAMESPTDYSLLPGMTASIQLDYRNELNAEHSFEIPASALVSEPDGALSVWLLNETDNSIKRQRVTASIASNGRIRVTQGLAGNELVVSSGTAFLQDTMHIVPLTL